MKKTLLYGIMLILALTAGTLPGFSQGWRSGEMEVEVQMTHPSDRDRLSALGLEAEPASRDGRLGRMYLVPGELEILKKSGLPFEITIPDMNRHVQNFWDNPLVPPGYYTYEQIIAIVDSLALNFPSICKKEMWGTSLGGRQLAALKISDNAATDEPEPEIMFDGGIHGDEVGGSQNVIQFARDLCLGYGSDPQITDLIDTREIWLYPMVNPDGRVNMSRYNQAFVDCNRDNGYMWNAEGNSPGAFSQPETKALRDGILRNQFIVYTNYHSGIEIISYPWSYRSASSRDQVHIHTIAGVYSTSSGYPGGLLYGQGYNIMYAINGSTKDFQYGSLGSVGWSIEISADKQPPSSQIGYFYNVNKPAMIQLITHCGYGISGMVTDSLTGQPVRATVWIDNFYPVYTDPEVGDYHKFVVPGTYTAKVTANGYRTKTISNLSVTGQSTTVADFQLAPSPGFYAWKVVSCRIPGNNFGDEGYTPGALGKPDSVPYSIGRNGWVILDMADTVMNGTGPDFKVWQSGTQMKSFTVSASNSQDGPFTIIGTGNGTTSFDLGSAGVQKARFLQVKDNGSGSATGPGAGFNLDAVENLIVAVSADFTVTDTTPCTGGYVDFADQSTGNPTSWNWTFPGGNPGSSTAQNPGNIRYDTPGLYSVSLTVSNGTTTSLKTRNGLMNVLPRPVVDLGTDTLVCAWNTVPLDAGNAGSEYLWSTGATTRTILADSTGTGYGTGLFSVTVTDPFGCASSDTIGITFDECTTVADPAAGRMSVAPNPSYDKVFLTIGSMNGGEWKLYSPLGNVLMGSAIAGDAFRISLDVSGFPPGVYVFRASDDRQCRTARLVIGQSRGR